MSWIVYRMTVTPKKEEPGFFWFVFCFVVIALAIKGCAGK
jgi:hypothetical protein